MIWMLKCIRTITVLVVALFFLGTTAFAAGIWWLGVLLFILNFSIFLALGVGYIREGYRLSEEELKSLQFNNGQEQEPPGF